MVDSVIESIDVDTIYDVPLKMMEEGLDSISLKKLSLKSKEPNLDKWKNFLHKLRNPENEIEIGLIGKYIELNDSYKSILESLIHAGTENDVKVNVRSIHSEYIDEENMNTKLDGLNGIIVAPGFGQRGIDGKILTINYARVNNIPFFGICLGMQMAVIEYAKNVKKIIDANSTEISKKCKNPVIDLMTNQKEIINKGGTMRLGAWDCQIIKDTKSYSIYNKKLISERHRPLICFAVKSNSNLQLLKEIKKLGCGADVVSIGEMMKALKAGINPNTDLVEIIENNSHPWFIGVQFHPEYKSSVSNPHPLFVNFVEASLKNYLNNN